MPVVARTSRSHKTPTDKDLFCPGRGTSGSAQVTVTSASKDQDDAMVPEAEAPLSVPQDAATNALGEATSPR